MVRQSAVLGCLMVSGCLLTTDLSGLGGDPTLDAGADRGPVSVADASDAPVDAGSEADAPLPSCGHTFCADFDESDSVAQGWANTEISGPGSLALERNATHSPPHAFVATMPASSGYDAALLTTSFGYTPAELHLDLQVYFDQLDVSIDQVSIGIMGVSNGDLSIRSDVRVNVLDGKAQLAEEYSDLTSDAGAIKSHTASAAYVWPLQRWVHVHVDVSPTTASLGLDGTTVATLSKLGNWSLPMTNLKLGVYYSRGQSGGQRIVLDDIVFDAK